MGSSGSGPESWNARLVSAVVDEEPSPVVYTHLDDLLHWLASADAPEAAPLAAELQRRSISSTWARRRALTLLERALFPRSEGDPGQTLGFVDDWTDVDLQLRYRLLMRVYHPDRAEAGSPPGRDHAQRINRAYAQARERVANARPLARWPSSPPNPRVLQREPWSRRIRARSSIRRKLVSPEAFRRRFLAGVLLACALLVLHTCVSNRHGIQLEPAAPPLPRPHQATHPFGSDGR
jgi:hypothetical protein